MKTKYGSSALGEQAGKKEKGMKSTKINFSDIPELFYTQVSRMRRVGMPNGRLCENSIGALRRGSGRTAKCLISKDVIPFVVSAVEP